VNEAPGASSWRAGGFDLETDIALAEHTLDERAGVNER